MVEFNHDNSDVVSDILDRASKKVHAFDRISLEMDIMAANGENENAPLDLEKLLSFDDFNFFHDIYGIQRHMNRKNGLLENCFLPRCSA